MVPAGITPAFEMIEPQLDLQIAILHFDGPAAARNADQLFERGVRRQIAEVLLPLAVDQRFLAQQPALAATLENRDAHRREARFERPLVPCPHRTRRHADGARLLAIAASESRAIVPVRRAPTKYGTATT